jgi:serine protease Do
MTGTPNPDRSTAVPDAALVHLSGGRRGTTEFISGDRIVLSPASNGGIELSTNDETTPHSLAVLERRGHTFRLSVTPGTEVWINGELIDELVLASGDMLEFGGGAVLRYRLYPPERRRYKTMAEAFSDCVECARHDSTSPIRRAAVFASRVPPEIMTQTAPRVRLVIVVLALAAIGLAGSALVRSARIERTLHSEVARVDGLARLLDRSENRAITVADIEVIRGDIDDLRDTEARIDELEALAGARERIIASASRSVVFLQGAYGFIESKTGRPLRFVVSPDGSPVIGPGGKPTFTAGGDGPEVEIFYTGTGFVATDDGRIVTNHHVAEPWLFDEEAQALIKQGLAPVMRRFIGYLPGQKEPFDVSLIAASETADVAVLRCQDLTAGLPALNLDDQALDVGDEVVVLGYPTGIRAMIARSQREIVPLLEARGEVDFWEVARILAGGGHIAPLATRGIVGQITTTSVVYDADTTHGGSGGPVIGLDGRVVAINAAVMPDFVGSNLGVPAAEALRLLAPPPETS